MTVKMGSRLAGIVLCLSAAAAGAFPAPPVQTPQELGFPGGSREEVIGRCKKVGLLPIDQPVMPGLDAE